MKRLACITLCIILAFSMVACKLFDSTEETNPYDYLVADIREYLQEEYGDILQFENPSVNEKQMATYFDWQIQYSSEFIDDSHIEYSDLYSLTEQIRTSMNEYFTENADSPLLKYYFRVIIAAPPIYENQPEEIIALFYNVTSNYVYYSQLVAINYQYYDFVDYAPATNPIEVNLKMHTEIDTVKSILNRLECVEIVLVRPEFKDELASEYPDISFI